jgi:hypothetical protein
MPVCGWLPIFLCGNTRRVTPHSRLAPALQFWANGNSVQPTVSFALSNPAQNKRGFGCGKVTHFPLQKAPVLRVRINKKRQAQSTKSITPPT